MRTSVSVAGSFSSRIRAILSTYHSASSSLGHPTRQTVFGPDRNVRWKSGCAKACSRGDQKICALEVGSVSGTSRNCTGQFDKRDSIDSVGLFCSVSED
jgi:hypothetical protein